MSNTKESKTPVEQPRLVRRFGKPIGHTGGSDYGRAVMDRNAAEDLAREAYANGDMKLRDEMLAEYRAAKERVKLYDPNAERTCADD